MDLEVMFYGILAAVVLGKFILQIYNTTSGDILTGPATVISRRVQQGNYQSARRNSKSLYVRSS